MNLRKKRNRKQAQRKLPAQRSIKTTTPRTASQYHAKPEKFKDMYDHVVAVVTRMRNEKMSLQEAAREEGVSPKTVKKWAGSALQKRTNGKWIARKGDTLLRVLKVPMADGPNEVAVRGSAQAKTLAEYWNALQRYLQTGDDSKLKKFKGKSIKDANGVQIMLPTDRKLLHRLGFAGVLSFESLYARTA